MRLLIVLLLILVAALGQTALGQGSLTRISPDEAATHLEKKVPPVYPPLAERARIQGDIVLEIKIDEMGKVTVLHPISGHPMLIENAMRAASACKYRPFEVGGKAVPVLTYVFVRFGDPKNQDARVRAQMRFLHDYWTTEESGRAALDKGDSAVAEQHLAKAHELWETKAEDVGLSHTRENWLWLVAMGELRSKQHKYEEAERYYNDALAVHSDHKEGVDNAAVLERLGYLHFDQQRYEAARGDFTKSSEIYRKSLKHLEPKNVSAQEGWGRALAKNAWMLSRIADEMKDSAMAKQQCGTVTEFQRFLNKTEHDAILLDCEKRTSAPLTSQ